jgi:hypothetical protein
VPYRYSQDLRSGQPTAYAQPRCVELALGRQASRLGRRIRSALQR